MKNGALTELMADLSNVFSHLMLLSLKTCFLLFAGGAILLVTACNAEDDDLEPSVEPVREPEAMSDGYEWIFTSDSSAVTGYRVYTMYGLMKWLYTVTVDDLLTKESVEKDPNKDLDLELMENITLPGRKIIADHQNCTYRFADEAIHLF